MLNRLIPTGMSPRLVDTQLHIQQLIEAQNKHSVETAAANENLPYYFWLKMKKSKSVIWEYFAYWTDIQGKQKSVDKPVCNECYKVVATKLSSTTNLTQHLKDRHPSISGEVNKVPISISYNAIS